MAKITIRRFGKGFIAGVGSLAAWGKTPTAAYEILVSTLRRLGIPMDDIDGIDDQTGSLTPSQSLVPTKKSLEPKASKKDTDAVQQAFDDLMGDLRVLSDSMHEAYADNELEPEDVDWLKGQD